MFFIAGISNKVKETGQTDCICPACDRSVQMHICNQYSTPHIFFIPTFRYNQHYFATCPSCASVMELDREKGKSFERDPDRRFCAEDFHILRNNRRARCSACGSIVSQEHNYCPNCGGRL